MLGLQMNIAELLRLFVCVYVDKTNYFNQLIKTKIDGFLL